MLTSPKVCKQKNPAYSTDQILGFFNSSTARKNKGMEREPRYYKRLKIQNKFLKMSKIEI